MGDVTNTVHQMINMTKESLDAGRTNHECLVALATNICTMAPNIFTIIIEVIFFIIVTITVCHAEALIDLFRLEFFSLHTIRPAKYVYHNYEPRSRIHCCSGKAKLHNLLACICRHTRRYPICAALVPSSHVWPVRLYNIFKHIS